MSDPKAPESTQAEVAPELKEEFDRLVAIIRGNGRLEAQLGSRNRGIDASMVLMLRVDMLIDTLLGAANESEQRLAFEIKFAERMREVLSQALLLT